MSRGMSLFSVCVLVPCHMKLPSQNLVSDLLLIHFLIPFLDNWVTIDKSNLSLELEGWYRPLLTLLTLQVSFPDEWLIPCLQTQTWTRHERCTTGTDLCTCPVYYVVFPCSYLPSHNIDVIQSEILSRFISLFISSQSIHREISVKFISLFISSDIDRHCQERIRKWIWTRSWTSTLLSRVIFLSSVWVYWSLIMCCYRVKPPMWFIVGSSSLRINLRFLSLTMNEWLIPCLTTQYYGMSFLDPCHMNSEFIVSFLC
jgi:hypothetical protein